MAASDPRPHGPLSLDEYFELEQASSVRHEYVGGQIFAMAGASDRHNRLAGNIYALLWTAMRGGTGTCRIYVSDMKVKVSDDQIFYPDVMVTCDPSDTGEYIKEKPCLIIEVLSPSTASSDLREKLVAYRRLESLNAYVVLYQDEMRAIRHWRDDRGAWWHAEVSGDGIVAFPCPELELTLAEIYAGIDLTG